MLVIVKLSSSLYEEAQELLPDKYRDLDQFIEVAIRNQISLETKGTKSAVTSVGTSSTMQAEMPGATEGAIPKASEHTEEWRRLVTQSSPDLLPVARSATVRSGAVLWGQMNRLLPTTVGVRVLAHMIAAGEGQEVDLAAWYEKATDVAVAWGRELERMDREASRKHGYLWSTGFPKEDRPSRRRYVSQFLGTPNSDGSLGGAELLDFVAFNEDGDPTTVGLTSAGVQWASLANPIFDGSDSEGTFGVLEARFFLEHLRSHLPDEYRFMKLMAELIDHGYDRTQIDAEITRAYSRWADYVETMRAGAVGRLHDLGLLHRIRKGQRVEYSLTELANDLGLPEPDQP